VADIAELNGWQEIIFFDQSATQLEKNGERSVSGDFDDLLSQTSSFDAVVVAIGNNQVRSEKSALLKQSGLELARLIHPSAIVSGDTTVAKGTVIMANAVLNPFSTIGENVIVNTGAIVEHDCVIDDGVHICPGVNLAGGVRVGQKAWVGIGSTVIQQCQIGEESLIGAGSVVINDIPPHVTVCGVPAKIIKSH
jgi:sugar O-acyltransferase (sialic acid O-acetyltransferase NeuD family)